MKQEPKNEMDLLLRRLGRRDELSAAGDHLDADELNAYAENVLPAAARARHTEHLADCARCRELVMQLSAAAGVVVAADAVKVAEPSVVKRFLAGLFSPMVLRYAAPALGLIVVVVIGVVVLRRDRASDLVTQVRQESPASVPASQNEPSEKAYSAPVDQPEQRKIDSNVDSRSDKSAEKNKSSESVPPAPNSPPAVTVTANASPEATGQKVDQIAANEPPPPAKVAGKPAAPTEEKQQQVVIVQPKGALASPTPAVQSSSDRAFMGRRQEREDNAAARDARPNKSAPAGAANTRSAGGVAKLGDTEVDKKAESRERAEAKESKEKAESKKDDADETRSVGGRRFRRESGIWIDTAYESGSTTNVTRGSEQYRALVADEPTIKNIADQLDGEIILIWKGRAYRIR